MTRTVEGTRALIRRVRAEERRDRRAYMRQLYARKRAAAGFQVRAYRPRYVLTEDPVTITPKPEPEPARPLEGFDRFLSEQQARIAQTLADIRVQGRMKKAALLHRIDEERTPQDEDEPSADQTNAEPDQAPDDVDLTRIPSGGHDEHKFEYRR